MKRLSTLLFAALMLASCSKSSSDKNAGRCMECEATRPTGQQLKQTYCDGETPSDRDDRGNVIVWTCKEKR